MTDEPKNAWKSFAEEIEVSGQHLLAEINKLIAEGNVRKLIVKTDDDRVFLTIPLTAGAVAGGVLTLGAPWLALLAAVAGLVARIKIEVVREGPDGEAEKPAAEAGKAEDSDKAA
jgi:CBS domain-containing protein